MSKDADKKSLAAEILSMTYGDLMEMSDVFAEILANEQVGTSGPELAASLHAWAKAENEASN